MKLSNPFSRLRSLQIETFDTRAVPPQTHLWRYIRGLIDDTKFNASGLDANLLSVKLIPMHMMPKHL